MIVWSAVFLFCVYGALASLEPSDGFPIHAGWFAGYVLVGLVSVGLAVRDVVHLTRGAIHRKGVPEQLPSD